MSPSHTVQLDPTYEQAIRIALEDENWSEASREVEETFVPMTPDSFVKSGLGDSLRELTAAFNLLPPPSIYAPLALPSPNAHITKLASYAHKLTMDMRDAEEYRRLWTLMLDAPSDFVRVWHIFLLKNDPRRNYALNLATDLAYKCCYDDLRAIELRHTWADLVQGGLCDLFPALFYRVHSPVCSTHLTCRQS